MADVHTFVRFMRHVEIGHEVGSCWAWTGNKPDGRYGHFSVGEKSVKAHRWMFEHLNGDIPASTVIRHKCDNPVCVNPAHLESGTAKQNIQDCVTRGRRADRKGERHPLATVNDEQVREIRRLADLGHTQRAIGERFEMSKSQVGKIVRRDNWGHVE